jgi:hypothetical protein
MSKEAALRAMREARYNQRAAAPAKAAKPAAPVAPAKAAAKPTPVKTTPVKPEASADGLCGHRSMNGRTCTREQGHAAKSHRYS